MNGEQKAIMVTIIVVVALVMGAAAGCNYQENVTWRTFATEGYEQVCEPRPGTVECKLPWRRAAR